MSSFGPPGVSGSHPSLPKRPPPSTVSSNPASYTATVSAPPTAVAAASIPTTASYGAASTSTSSSSYYGTAATAATAAPPSNSASSAGTGQPRLAYSHTYASVGGQRSGRPDYSSYASYSQPAQTYGGGGGGGGGAHHPYGHSGAANYGIQSAAAAAATSASTAPQIRNPFPAPGERPAYEDPHIAAQISNWQSAYVSKDYANSSNNNNNSYPYLAGSAGAGAAGASGAPSHMGYNTGNAAAVAGGGAAGYQQGGYGDHTAGASAASAAAAGGAVGADAYGAAGANAGSGAGAGAGTGKQKTVVRSGGGKTWTDETLLEWDPSHLRLFVGNLAGEVTDETLYKAFARWRSVQKARVIRDKLTKKSRGYGFVSFSDADDFFQAAKEMHGKYIGSHPVVVRKSNTDIKVSAKDDKKNRNNYNKNNKNQKNKNKKKSGSGSGSGSGVDHGRRDPYEPSLGPVPSGVSKHQKTKGGLKLLG